MEGQDIKGLMEAYSHIYSEPEFLGEEVETEEVNMEVEEDSEVLDESSRNRFRKPDPEQVAANRRGFVNRILYGNPEGRRPRTGGGQSNRRRNRRSSSTPTPTPSPSPSSRPTPAPAARPTPAPAARPTPAPAARPSSAPASKPAAAAPAKPVVKQTGDKSKDMAAWAKANPKLAAAKAERDRTRGTSATTNPLMKDMKSRLPAPKTLSKTDAGANFGSAVKAGQSMNNKPAASKPAAGAKFNPNAPKINLKQDVDTFDLVKGHLLDEGYAETEQAALTIMANMSEEWRQDILEFLGGQKGDGYLGHPRLGIKNPMAKKQTPTKTSSNTGLAGKLGNRAAALDAAMGK